MSIKTSALRYKEKALSEACIPWLLPPDLSTPCLVGQSQGQKINLVEVFFRKLGCQDKPVKSSSKLLFRIFRDYSQTYPPGKLPLHKGTPLRSIKFIGAKEKRLIHPTSRSVPGRDIFRGIHFQKIQEITATSWISSDYTFDSNALEAYQRVSRAIKPKEKVHPIKDSVDDVELIIHEEFDWIEKYSDDILQHRGMYVALSAEGIIGIGISMKDAADQARENGFLEPFLFEVPTIEQSNSVLIG
jgi:hypothetical protein